MSLWGHLPGMNASISLLATSFSISRFKQLFGSTVLTHTQAGRGKCFTNTLLSIRRPGARLIHSCPASHGHNSVQGEAFVCSCDRTTQQDSEAVSWLRMCQHIHFTQAERGNCFTNTLLPMRRPGARPHSFIWILAST